MSRLHIRSLYLKRRRIGIWTYVSGLVDWRSRIQRETTFQWKPSLLAVGGGGMHCIRGMSEHPILESFRSRPSRTNEKPARYRELSVPETPVPETTLTLPAFAKINWTLRVLGKRDDGYHEIDTVFQTISLHDTIKIIPTEANHIVLSCDDRSLPSDERNLVWRAAAALQVRCSIQKGARIRLEKRIPVHAGLGGGSSDAAATLLGLAYLWNATISEGELLELAAGLG